MPVTKISLPADENNNNNKTREDGKEGMSWVVGEKKKTV